MSLPINKYTVQKNDTLYKIARENNTSIARLIQSNPSINPYTLVKGQIINIPTKPFKEYENPVYNVRFKFPYPWRKISDVRYEDTSGFFNVSAISSIGTIEDVCKSEACHKQLPYGSKPSICRTHHLGKKACIIIPSDDQSPIMNNQGAFIIEYPFEVNIMGCNYNFFLLWASKDHISEIIKSLKFIKVKK